MRLLRLHVTGFGNLRERAVEFGPGLTVLVGRNETGKSTILCCISQVMYGKPSARKSFPDADPWDGGPFAAALDFDQEGARYRLTRRFDEAGARAVALHRLGDDGAETLVTQEAAEVRRWVAGALGTGDDRIFYRVFCLTQADLDPLDNYEGLREQLERATSGAEVAVTAAAQRIDERLARLRRGIGQPALPQNWGPLKRAQEAVRDWEGQLAEAQRRARRRDEAREELSGVRQRIADATSRKEVIARTLETDRQRREWQGRLAELTASWEGVEGERERVDRLKAKRDRLQGLLGEFPAACADTGALRERLRAADQPAAPLVALAAVVIIAGFAGAVILSVITRSIIWLLFAVVGIALGLWLAAPAARRRRSLKALLAELGVGDVGAASERLSAVERYELELDATSLALQTVGDAEQMAARRRSLAADMAALKEKIAELPGAPLSAEEAHRLTAEAGELDRELPGLRERERALTREVAVLEETERELVDLEDGAAYWREEEARAREDDEALRLARELLETAGRQAHDALSTPLGERISPLFAAITEGRYPQVRVTGSADAFQVTPVDAAGASVPREQLSQGAHDQLVLAVRLALGQVIAGAAAAPVFLLDDPLLRFDAARRREALAVLEALSAEAQIILATHDERILAALRASTVVRLDTEAPPAPG